MISPESSTRTADSGIESICPHGDESEEAGDEPVATTRNEDVDRCLLFHLSYTEWLLGHLGKYTYIRMSLFHRGSTNKS